MTTITIERRDLRPHETVTGRVAWALEKEPRELELRLCWFTRGRGTEEARTIEVLPLGDTLRGERAFSFRLPAEPWSVNGTLVQIVWALEVVAKKTGSLGVEEFVVAPQRSEITLHEIESARTVSKAEKWVRRFGRAKR
ncbi:hypothetical protein OKA05_07405 [Luteolibacter arcticus]|uniref:CYTH domain-containing protein n=1 Tax=Luteolibacter arcticus TaxID=1581411 RepID=A0ABT3GFH9_9BACT|nr:hypothetical protein [Luteolibacter arcticus]MCW1922375.1 hypothetical protein [Luteolibacter arcticus]